VLNMVNMGGGSSQSTATSEEHSPAKKARPAISKQNPIKLAPLLHSDRAAQSLKGSGSDHTKLLHSTSTWARTTHPPQQSFRAAAAACSVLCVRVCIRSAYVLVGEVMVHSMIGGDAQPGYAQHLG